ncbi:MAG: hypothetical protein AAGF28_10865 [Pseudomonadota bacterium]
MIIQKTYPRQAAPAYPARTFLTRNQWYLEPDGSMGGGLASGTGDKGAHHPGFIGAPRGPV